MRRTGSETCINTVVQKSFISAYEAWLQAELCITWLLQVCVRNFSDEPKAF